MKRDYLHDIRKQGTLDSRFEPKLSLVLILSCTIFQISCIYFHIIICHFKQVSKIFKQIISKGIFFDKISYSYNTLNIKIFKYYHVQV